MTAFRIVVPDLRNGAVENVLDAAPSASIPERFYWVAIRGMPSAKATQFVKEFIVAQYGQITFGTAYATNAGVAALCRREAILLGTARAVMTEAYRLTMADMTTAECKWSTLEYRLMETDTELDARKAELTENADLAEDERAADLTARRAALTKLPERIAHRPGNATADARAGREAGFGNMSDADWDIANVAGWLAIAIPLVQGVSLVNSGHHYIDTTKKMFDGVYKQAKFLHTPIWSTLEEQMAADLKDRLFHKAAHPIRPDRKRDWSKSHTKKAMLVEARHGAAAIRLPAMPAEASGLKAGLACMEKASGTITQLKGKVNLTAGKNLLSNIEGTGETIPTDAELKAYITTAIDWFNVHQGSIAYCAGVVDKMRSIGQESSDKTLPAETTTSAFSVRKAIAANTAQYVLGSNLAALRMKKDKEDLDNKGYIELEIIA